MDEQEHPAGAGPSEPPAAGMTQPVTGSATGQPERHRRAGSAWKVLTSRGGGWAVAAALLGAVVTLSVFQATTPSAVAVQVPSRGPVSFSVGPGGPGWPPGMQVHVVAPAQIYPGGPGIGEVIPFGGPGPAGAQIVTPLGRVIVGTVSSLSSSGFTLTTVPGQTVTVGETSATVYQKAGSSVTAGAITRGARVAVLGSPSGGSRISAIVVAVLSG